MAFSRLQWRWLQLLGWNLHIGELSRPDSNRAPCIFSAENRLVMSDSSLKDPKATISRGGSSRRRMNQLLQSNRSSKSSETIHLSPYFLNSSSSVLLPIGGSVRSMLFDPPAAKLGTKPAAVLLLMTCSHRCHAARPKQVETQR